MKKENLHPEESTVTIGKQVWMTKNLNVDKFRNGDPIPEVKTNREWRKVGREGNPAWCYYDNDPKNGTLYGKLYNWHAVNDPRGLAPEGWKVPTADDWKLLCDFLSKEYLADESLDEEDIAWAVGEKLKSKEYWDLNRDGELGNGNNESGFTGLPAGRRFMFNDLKDLKKYKSFLRIGTNGGWWSSTESCETLAHYLTLDVNSSLKIPDFFKAIGFSVRCLKE